MKLTQNQVNDVLYNMGYPVVAGLMVAAALADEKDKSIGPSTARQLEGLREMVRQHWPEFDGDLTPPK